MRKYYYTDGKAQFGPFEAEELRPQGVTARTLVWCEGMANWQAADTLDELKYLFEGQGQGGIPVPPPPVFAQFDNGTSEEQKPKNPPASWLVESILVTLFCCLPFGIIGIINAAKVESAFYAGRYEESQKASNDARKWMQWGFWTGLIGGVVYFMFLIAMVMAEAAFKR